MSARRGDDGLATLLALSLGALLCLCAVGVAVLGSAVEARHRAAATADLAALAGAQSAQRYEDPCLAAALLAARNGARLEDCHLDGGTVRVQVRVSTTLVLGIAAVPDVVQSARAGPVTLGGNSG